MTRDLGRIVLVSFASMIVPLIQPGKSEAQAPSAEANGVSFEGPPPPTAPEVASWDNEGRATVRAVRVPGLRVDGELDESFYEQTSSISDFIQTVPEEGSAPTELTETWVAFDDSNVYISARIWESAPPSEWVANEMVRDNRAVRGNDHFGIFLDTFYDRRNAVAIYLNALGGFNDMQITNEGSPNRDWNPVLDIQTGRFDGGWTVEVAVPFRSLRYHTGTDQVWGIQMRRFVARKNEWSYLTFLPLSVSGNGSQGIFRVSMYGTLVGIEAPPPSRNLEVKPYAISGIETDLTADPQVSNDGHADIGLDIKYGITENLTADLTFNTDFAQVEVDEQQVNLTRFSLFFPEKREFFLESRGIFDFGQGGRSGGGGGGPPPTGGGGRGGPGGGGGGGGGVGAPTLFYSRRIGLQEGEPIPILAGGRVTGKVGAFDVGVVTIQADDDPNIGAQSTNFTVLRLRRDIFARSSIGVLYENRSSSTVAESGSNQAYGVDASFAFLETVSFVTSYAKTKTEGLTRNDESYQARFNYNADRFGAQIGHLLVGDDFNPEIGFVRRKGFRNTALMGRVSHRPSSVAWIRRVSVQGNLGYFENERIGYVESRDRSGRLGIELENGDFFNLAYRNTFENLIVETPISGADIPAGRYSFDDFEASYQFAPQRRISGRVSVRNGRFYSGDLTSLGLGGARVEILPQLTLEPSVEFNWISLPDLEEFAGEFNQHVARARVTYSLSPRTFLSGLIQYNAGGDTFSANVRLRWEWAPGSELFIVYTEDRDTDVLDRWSQLSTRGLVIKVNRLLRP